MKLKGEEGRILILDGLMLTIKNRTTHSHRDPTALPESSSPGIPNNYPASDPRPVSLFPHTCFCLTLPRVIDSKWPS